MRLKLERTDERLTRRTGLILINRFGEKINLASAINRAFREPGSNRGFDASDYILALSGMIIDGATCLEDIRLFENDEAYKEMAEVRHYPSSDAIGDRLRRYGGTDGEALLWIVISSLIQTMTGGSGLTLDLDGTLIEADKGDAQLTYKGSRGYHPLVGGCTELGLFVGSRFQHGNATPHSPLASRWGPAIRSGSPSVTGGQTSTTSSRSRRKCANAPARPCGRTLCGSRRSQFLTRLSTRRRTSTMSPRSSSGCAKPLEQGLSSLP